LNFRARLTRANKGAKVIFLDCPYYSTKKYNLLNKKSTKNVKTDKVVSQDKNNIKVTIKGNSKSETRKVLKSGYKKNKKLSVSFSNRKPIEPLYEDSNLSQVIDYYNEHLRWHNPIKTPKFSSDIIASHKRASCSKTKYKKNYTFYRGNQNICSTN